MDWTGPANATWSLASLLSLPGALGDYKRWALYGAVLVISCVLLGVYCACLSIWQYVNCCLCPLRSVWWLVSTAVATVKGLALFLIRLVKPI